MTITESQSIVGAVTLVALMMGLAQTRAKRSADAAMRARAPLV